MSVLNTRLNFKNKFPSWLITVTPLSKTLALILMIVLPFMGFFLGISYQRIVDNSPSIQYISLSDKNSAKKSLPMISPKPTNATYAATINQNTQIATSLNAPELDPTLEWKEISSASAYAAEASNSFGYETDSINYKVIDDLFTGKYYQAQGKLDSKGVLLDANEELNYFSSYLSKQNWVGFNIAHNSLELQSFSIIPISGSADYSDLWGYMGLKDGKLRMINIGHDAKYFVVFISDPLPLSTVVKYINEHPSQ